jgi:hypothetical protein
MTTASSTRTAPEIIVRRNLRRRREDMAGPEAGPPLAATSAR